LGWKVTPWSVGLQVFPLDAVDPEEAGVPEEATGPEDAGSPEEATGPEEAPAEEEPATPDVAPTEDEPVSDELLTPEPLQALSWAMLPPSSVHWPRGNLE
jgi:hypothetical protein